MWDTSTGRRTLQRTEAVLFAEAMLFLLDNSSVSGLEYYTMDIKAFDNLTYGQKVFTLWTTAQGLLCENVRPVPRTAALEATIAAVFDHIEGMMYFEVEPPEEDDDPVPGPCLKELIICARKEAGADEVISIDNRSHDDWNFEVQQILDNILGDVDYATSDIYQDLPPEEAEAMKSLIGIPDEYTLAIPEDLSDQQAAKALAEVKKLCCQVISFAD